MKNFEDNITDLNNSVKTFSDALVSFNTTLAHTFVEANTKAWGEMVKLGETTNKIVKELPIVKDIPSFKDMPTSFNKSFTPSWMK